MKQRGRIDRVARRVLRERLHLVPPAPAYALPGVARALELGWAWTLRRKPVLDLADYGATVAVGEIEELLACPLCGDRRVQPLFAPGEPGRGGYRVVRCPACGLMYRNPGVRPERLGDLYDTGRYAKFLTGHYADRRQDSYRLAMDAFGPLFADGAGRRLLDYGCGAGLFLELAHERGFEGYGVDLSPDAVERARRQPGGARTYVGAPEDVPEIAAGGFDVVTMWSVLAHLATPIEDVGGLRRLLAPDGVLLILTVNANSLLLKVQRQRWDGFTPNHLAFYAPETLPELLRRAGFGAVVIRSLHGPRVESGELRLAAPVQRRLRRVTARGEQGNMMRAVAFADPDGPRRWGMEREALRL